MDQEHVTNSHPGLLPGVSTWLFLLAMATCITATAIYYCDRCKQQLTALSSLLDRTSLAIAEQNA